MRIAVVGSGISGMLAARLLCGEHDVHVFEAGNYVGGHTNTVDIDAYGGRYAIDTGFMVFNERTYPNFIRMLRMLGVGWQASDMSFSVRVERTGLEYSGTSLNTLFAQRRNLLRPAFYRMLRDVLRFNREAREQLHEAASAEPPNALNKGQTVGELLAEGRYSRQFAEHYLLPMAAAIWSAPPAEVRSFPAKFLIQFFHNHGLLNVYDRPQWFTVAGTARRYVEELTRPYREQIRLNTPVRRIERSAEGVEISTAAAEAEPFDAVVLATHSDTSLAILADPSPAEREILGSFVYQPNEAIVHTDASLLPRRKLAWASWNAHVFDDTTHPAAVTYYLNRLQQLVAPGPLCVTLNHADAVDPSKILRRIQYHHPVYNHSAVAAQRRWAEINGVQQTYFCGAYWGFGFHEDGVNSALAVGKLFGKTLESCTVASTSAPSTTAVSSR